MAITYSAHECGSAQSPASGAMQYAVERSLQIANITSPIPLACPSTLQANVAITPTGLFIIKPQALYSRTPT